MQFQIEVINVGTPQTVPTKGGKSYQSLEIAFKRDGKIEGKKLVSFTNPHVFNTAKDLKPGDVVFVTSEKGQPNAQGQSFWQWEGISKDGGSQMNAASSGGTPTTQKASGGTWETKEERAARQVMIVRQSSLTNAVATLAVGAKTLKPEDVVATAKIYESYVLDTENNAPEAAKASDDFFDDIPY